MKQCHRRDRWIHTAYKYAKKEGEKKPDAASTLLTLGSALMKHFTSTLIEIRTYLPPHLGSPGQRLGTFVTGSVVPLLRWQHSQLSDSQAQVLEDEKTKSTVSQTWRLRQG